jgi:hypothetical protein
MDSSRGSASRRLRGNSRTNLRHVPDGDECRDWLKENLAPLPVGEISQEAGLTKRAAENIKAGDNGMRMEHLVAFCRNDPQFRAAFIEFVGGEVALPAEITMAINAYVQRKAREP